METVDYPGVASQMTGILEDPEDYKSKGCLENRFYDTNTQAQYVQKTTLLTHWEIRVPLFLCLSLQLSVLLQSTKQPLPLTLIST
jgi:hypothetical protein